MLAEKQRVFHLFVNIVAYLITIIIFIFDYHVFFYYDILLVDNKIWWEGGRKYKGFRVPAERYSKTRNPPSVVPTAFKYIFEDISEYCVIYLKKK